MKILKKEHVLRMHSDIINTSGGTDGIRDVGMLESALCSPFQTFGGYELYPSLLQKAARLGYSLIKNHPFIDGNKRIGTHTMLVFLDINGIELIYSDIELLKIIQDVAAGISDDAGLLNWLEEHTVIK